MPEKQGKVVWKQCELQGVRVVTRHKMFSLVFYHWLYQLQLPKMNNPVIPESRQRRTPGISGLFKLLLKGTRAVRNGCAAEEWHKNKQRQPLHAGCCRKRARSRQAQEWELGYQGVGWTLALPELKGSGVLQEPWCCWQRPRGHGEGATGDQQMTPTLAAELKHAQLTLLSRSQHGINTERPPK